MLTAITGINWGDEGKGRMVDLLSANYDIVVRYQGGNNAGHTVVNEKGRFILNLMPSGILRDGVVNVLGNGMVIDIKHLVGEIERLRAGGITITPENLKISDRAVICMPYHVSQDILEEERLAEKKFGSTRRGIAPVYADKYFKKGIRMGDLFELESLKSRLADIVEWKNLTLSKGYGAQAVSAEEMYAHIVEYGTQLLPFICDTGAYLDKAAEEGKNIMFEAQLGALRDVDFGIYPFTSSSNTIAAYAPIGAGIPNRKLDNVIGIMKAYSSCVGEGPFTCELFGEAADKLREAGSEYGAATGRPRRVGGFDVVASRYGIRVQGADFIALTKLDILSYMEKIPICVAYEVDGVRTQEFPIGAKLDRAKPVYEYLDGWMRDISGCRKLSDLPENARKYVEFIEKSVGCPIKYISVGAEREQYIEV
ncbi:MAG TPA: adenylosuccinate synthase [Bacillota bacterium]|nr:adenylosuccinate synthase [Bacillota bacterium]HOK68328.1 adenylosuccinate synthase [Bacillota bacterium]HPP85238.1 adenylosuccinate synthase [Bacillota bacterium]